jgi:hypothetical protein
METLFLVLLALIVLAIIIALFKYLVTGALSGFMWASQQGFIGTVAFFACWIFLFPFMLAACIIAGAVTSRSD